MSILNRGAGPFPALARRARQHRVLADDTERIARGEHPTGDDLQDAPTLFDWRLHMTPLPFLSGTVLGHPELGDGAFIRTSELVTFDPITGYARTFSRFYRLRIRSIDPIEM